MDCINPLSAKLLWMEAHSFIHVGIGKQPGLIDQPIARESGTGWPYVPGSGAKGAYRDIYRTTQEKVDTDRKVVRLFGSAAGEDANSSQDDATNDGAEPGNEPANGQGLICVNDIKIFALPVRSPTHGTIHITCPGILRRLNNDRAAVGDQRRINVPDIADRKFKSLTSSGKLESQIVLEHYRFWLDEEGEQFATCLPDECQYAKFAVINDQDFLHFTDFHVHVRMRNKLDPVSKVAENGALWNEESLPPGTLFTQIVHVAPNFSTRKKDVDDQMPLDELFNALSARNQFFQVGGNETVGEGYLRVLEAPALKDGGPNNHV